METAKGFEKPVFLVASVILVFIFIYALWSAMGPYLQSGFDQAFQIAGIGP